VSQRAARRTVVATVIAYAGFLYKSFETTAQQSAQHIIICIKRHHFITSSASLEF
jgi:hypothetical protein